MSRVQRIYIYTAALVSLMVLLISAVNASAGLIELAFDVPSANAAAPLLWLLVAAISGAAWAVHWYLVNREAGRLPTRAAERAVAERNAYLYVTQFGALAVLVTELAIALYYLFLLALGQPPELLGPWPARLLAAVVGAALALGVWAFQYMLAVRDGDLGVELGSGRAWRRGCAYLGVALAALMAAFGAGEFLRNFLLVAGRIYAFGLPAADAGASRALVAASLAVAVVGLPLVFLLWHAANRGVAAGDVPIEVNALSRKLLIYAGMMAGAALTLVGLGYLVWQGLIAAFGGLPGNMQVFWEQALVPALAYLPVGVLVWLAFSAAMQSDIEWADENQEAAVLRRLYYYLMTALTLAAFWYGLQALLVLAILLLLSIWPPAILEGAEARQFFSLAGALLIVGAPAWLAHWRSVQSLAREPGPIGRVERASLLRKIYLYGVVLAAGLVVVVTLIVVISRTPGWLFGPRAAGGFGESMVELGVGIAVALFWWLGHGLVLRGDERLSPAEEQLPVGRVSEPPRGRRLAAVVPTPGPPSAQTAPAAVGRIVSAPAAIVEGTALPDGAALPPPADRVPVPPDLPAREPTAGSPRPTPDLPPAVAALGATLSGPQPSQEQSPPQSSEQGPQVSSSQGPPLSRLQSPQQSPLRSRHFTMIAVVDGADGALGAALLTALRQEMPNLILWPVWLSAQAQFAMSAVFDGRLPPQLPPPIDAVSRAGLILGPSDMLAPGGLDGEVSPELAAAIGASPAHKILLPPRQPLWRWVGAPDWPRERWVENAVAEVASVLSSGQEGQAGLPG